MKKKKDNNKQSYIFTRETLGMTVLLFCVLMLLILLTYNTVFSSLGTAVCTFMYGTFGYASYLVVAALACLGVWLVFEKRPHVKFRTAAAVGLAVYIFFLLFHAVTTRDYTMESYGAYLGMCYTNAEAGYSGYSFGGALAGIIVYPVAKGTTFIGAYVIFSVLLALSGYLAYITVRKRSLLRKNKAAKVRNAASDAPSAVPQEPVVQAPVIQEPAVSAYPVDDGYGAAENYSAPPQGGWDYVPQPEPYVPPVNEYIQPAPPADEDKFSDENLGRRILFDNGEFAAESYRRNMIFNDDSYFNHPVHNDSDYLSSFSSGKKPSTPAQTNYNRPSYSQPATEDYSKTYSQSYSEEVERSEHRPATPSYIYGDKPVDKLDDIPEHEEEYGGEPSYDDEPAEEFGGDDYSHEPHYSDDSYYEEAYGREEDKNDYCDDESGEEDDFTIRSDRRRDDDFLDMGRTAPTGDGGRASSVPPSRSLHDELLEDDSGRDDVRPRESFGGATERRSRQDFTDDGYGADDLNLSEQSRSDREGGEDLSRLLRRGEQPMREQPDEEVSRDEPRQEKDNPNSLRNIFSSSNTNISDDIKPDASRLSSRREGDRSGGRENIFDDGEDDYLAEQDEPDLGTRGLRSGDRSEGVSSERPTRYEAPSRSESVPSRSVQNEKKEESAPAQPEKPKHVWKKYVRPSLDLLADYPENNSANYGEIEDNKKLIIETLENFRIASHISDVVIGPAITRYDVIIEDRTNIKNAMRYREAIAMALMKENVTAYLNYSKGAISIEVPNSKRTIVGLKSMLTSNEFVNCKPNTLTFALGKNVEGKPNCPDITKMPHLLVAGTTGSGKSICLSSLIISLLYKYGPDELRFILVDPKQSEFISYENLPHLIVNEIISDVDKAIKALNWAIKEMERRYALFKEMTLAGTLVKNINEYNAHLPEGEEKLPKIVIILDEFGDLMLQNKKDIESRIIRLVQKSRACGIHLILATQRPSVDCITGLIKSNLPTRIGFKVNSFDDSRTIFDIGGAEKLLGAGDMYYRSAQNPDLARIQGCFIDSPEVQAVTDFIKKNNETYFDQSVSDFINTVEEPEASNDDAGGEGDVKIDDKFIQALKFCVTSNQASVSMLQRRFPIGYVKACKIIDWMENMNYITQSEGAKPRKVLLSLDEFTRIYGDVDD